MRAHDDPRSRFPSTRHQEDANTRAPRSEVEPFHPCHVPSHFTWGRSSKGELPVCTRKMRVQVSPTPPSNRNRRSTFDCPLRAIHAIPTARLVQQQDTSLPNCEYGCDSHASLWPTKRPFHEPILGRGSPIATRRARARLPLGSRKYRIARSDDDILNSRAWPTSNATPTEGRRGSRPSDLTGYPPVPTDSGTGLRSRMSRFDSSRGD